MINQNTKIFSGLLGLTFLLISILPISVVHSADLNQKKNLCGGAELTVDSGACGGNGEAGINKLIENIVNVLSVIVGIVAVVMIIVGGFRYITSGGDSGNVSGAKNTILYAIVGLVIVALAQFIVRYVINQSTDLT